MNPTARLIRERVFRAVARESAPTRAQVHTRARWLAAAAFLTIAGEAWLAWTPAARGPRMVGASVWALGVALALRPLRRCSRSATGLQEWRLWIAILASWALPSAVALSAAPMADGERLGARAFQVTLLLGLPALLALLGALARSEVWNPELLGAALGALSGTGSALGVAAALPLRLAHDVLVGQVLPAGLQIGLGASLGAQLLSPAQGSSARPRRLVAVMVAVWLACGLTIPSGRGAPEPSRARGGSEVAALCTPCVGNCNQVCDDEFAIIDTSTETA